MAKFKVKKDRKFFWGPRWNFFGTNNKEFNIRVMFHGDCVYRLSENYDQINKLAGQSFRFLPFYDKESNSIKPGHQKDSVRFGWRCINGIDIEIMAYAYIDGVRKDRMMLSISAEEWVSLNFKETDSYYIFSAISESGEAAIVKFKKNRTKKGFLGLFIHRLYPYFGGKIAAPHNMRIELKYVKKFI